MAGQPMTAEQVNERARARLDHLARCSDFRCEVCLALIEASQNAEPVEMVLARAGLALVDATLEASR